MSIKKFNPYKLQAQESIQVKAGAEAAPTCGCSCKYAGTPGGSSTFDNGMANAELGIRLPGVPVQFFTKPVEAE